MSSFDNLKLSNHPATIIKSPFFVFCIDKYLPEGLFDELDKSFPSMKYFCRVAAEGSKKSFSSRKDADVFQSFIKESLVWKEFVEALSSYAFINDLKFLCRDALRSSRGISAYKIWKKSNDQKKIIDKIFYRLIDNIDIQFEFSVFSDGGYIRPHTDSRKKLISLLLYFPDDKWDNSYKGGTTFFDTESSTLKQNWENKPLDDYTGLIPFYETPYEKNILCGFVKSCNSWHSVERLKLPDGIFRRSLCINIIRV